MTKNRQLMQPFRIHGQIWSMDFTASIVILLIVLIPALLLWSNIGSDASSQRAFLKAEKQSLMVTDLMVTTPGVPASWNNEDVISIGFADEKNVFSYQKLYEFNRTDYQKLKTIFGYDFYFELKDINGTVYYTKGQQPSFQNTTMPVERRGLYNERIVILDLTLWY